ncbi:MAG TPA: D-aminoacyl-tRNA deacylase, partial [Thermoanaerobaculia bacterium]|nr:D-aminoacyl-tRNA deacylase [Thermoanaerobaculia bacterium]
SFDAAAPPEVAEPLVEALVAALRAEGATVATGRFRAYMEVELVNDGPVTFVLDVPPGVAEGGAATPMTKSAR